MADNGSGCRSSNDDLRGKRMISSRCKEGTGRHGCSHHVMTATRTKRLGPSSCDESKLGKDFMRNNGDIRISLFHRKPTTILLALIAICKTFLHVWHIDTLPPTAAFVLQRHLNPSTILSPPPSKICTILPRTWFSQTSSRRPLTTLCGIRGFRAWFEQQFPNAVKRVDASTSHDQFDHVLVDMNQILHTIVRKARGQDHLIKLLFHELDELLRLTNPTQSLVLAVDGPAPAAKIATQRKRRFALLKNTQFKLKNFDKLRLSSKERAKRLRTYRADLRALQVTPGTDSMRTMEQAILYWAWQRLHSQGRPYSKIRPRVKIYISSSRVPGEGEIKLLEWVNNRRGHLSSNAGESIALVGGDADLLLEAMVIPPSWTHNVFVLRPEDMTSNTSNREFTNDKGITGGSAGERVRKRTPGGKFVLCTSVWEMTRDLDEYCRQQLSAEVYNPEKNKRDQNLLLQLRTDLVLLLVLNGNDYLPKTVSADFRHILDTYMTLMKHWLERSPGDGAKEDDGSNGVNSESSSGNSRTMKFGLVDPNTLTFRLDFCASFFRVLGQNSPTEEERSMSVKKSVRRTYLSILKSMTDIGFVPRPVRYSYFDPSDSNSSPIPANKISLAEEESDDNHDSDEDDDYEKYEDENDDDDDDDDDDDFSNENDDDEGDGPSGVVEGYTESDVVMDNEELLVLTLGEPGTEGFRRYEILSKRGIRANSEKQLLAKKALEDLALFDVIDTEDDITRTDYKWELDKPADSNIERYLAGLLWTLQTYQDGVCPNYSYNYGKCLAPICGAIADYFEQAILDEREVGAEQLISSLGPGGPITAGLACLAALPASVEDLVPEPYGSIPADKVEELYGSCVDPSDNWFDMRKFQRVVEGEVMKLPSLGSATKRGNRGGETGVASNEHINGRRILLGDHFWTVLGRTKSDLEHPFQAPDPPSDKFYPLKPNPRVKVSRLISIDRLQRRPGFNSTALVQPSSKASKNMHLHKSWMSPNAVNVDHSDFGAALLGNETPALSTLSYKIAFGGQQNPPNTSELVKKKPFALLKPAGRSASFSSQLSDDNIYEISPNDASSTDQPVHNIEGHYAVEVLNMLRDVGVVGEYEFELFPSNSFLQVERLVLTIYKGSVEGIFPYDNITFAQDWGRHQSKRLWQHGLASMALDSMLSQKNNDGGSMQKDRWTSMTFRTLRGRLNDADPREHNVEGKNAVQVLSMLCDVGVIGGYHFKRLPSNSLLQVEQVEITVCKGSVEGIFPYENITITQDWGRHQSWKVKKQSLASMALDSMLSQKNIDSGSTQKDRWIGMTFDTLRGCLKETSKA